MASYNKLYYFCFKLGVILFIIISPASSPAHRTTSTSSFVSASAAVSCVDDDTAAFIFDPAGKHDGQKRIRRQLPTTTATAVVDDPAAAAIANTMPHIIDIKANCSLQGMDVTIVFDKPYDGIIYSKDHYRDAQCNWVRPKSARTAYSFQVPMNGCGTTSGISPSPSVNSQPLSSSANLHKYFENTLILQNDPIVQEMWDTARTLRCDWQTRFDSVVAFPVLNVADDLPQQQQQQQQKGIQQPSDIAVIEFSGRDGLGGASDDQIDKVHTKMEMLIGNKSFESSVDRMIQEAQPIGGGQLVEIGEPLILVIYVYMNNNADAANVDVSVQKCTAYDETSSRTSQNRPPMIMTDDNGCALRPKLFPQWQMAPRNANVRGMQAQITVYNSFEAFKFPDSSTVTFECELSICKYGGCHAKCPIVVSMQSTADSNSITNSIQHTNNGRNRRAAPPFPSTLEATAPAIVNNNTTSNDNTKNVGLRKSVTVVTPQDVARLKDGNPLVLTAEYYQEQRLLRQKQQQQQEQVTFCVNLISFIVLVSIISLVLLVCVAITFYMCIKKKTVVLTSTNYHGGAGSSSSGNGRLRRR